MQHQGGQQLDMESKLGRRSLHAPEAGTIWCGAASRKSLMLVRAERWSILRAQTQDGDNDVAHVAAQQGVGKGHTDGLGASRRWLEAQMSHILPSRDITAATPAWSCWTATSSAARSPSSVLSLYIH